MRAKALVCLVLGLAAMLPAKVTAQTFVEDFSSMPTGTCYPDGYTISVWQFVFNGYGCSEFVSWSSNTALRERPKVSTRRSETHSALVIGPSVAGDFTLEVFAATTQQLRTSSTPHPWEVAWVLWHYTDNAHFYYFIAKPTGWELGKEDPAYPGSQRFLATNSYPTYPIGPWYKIRVAQVGDTIQVFVNDVGIVTFTDQENPYSAGRVGLYSEDAEAYFDNVSVSTDATLTDFVPPQPPPKGHKPH
jgi:Domain of Unknown Function (DUF1080)